MQKAGFLGIIAILALCLAPAVTAKRVPNLEFKDLTGSSKSLSELRGSIAVINFWATWCGPCREELPLLSELNQQYAGKKIRFIAISADEDADTPKVRAKIEEFLKEHKLAMEVWIGADLDSLDHLGLGNELPATVIVDEQGEVISRVLGQAHEEDVKAPVDWLLNGRQEQAPTPVTKHY